MDTDQHSPLMSKNEIISTLNTNKNKVIKACGLTFHNTLLVYVSVCIKQAIIEDSINSVKSRAVDLLSYHLTITLCM